MKTFHTTKIEDPEIGTDEAENSGHTTKIEDPEIGTDEAENPGQNMSSCVIYNEWYLHDLKQ